MVNRELVIRVSAALGGGARTAHDIAAQVGCSEGLVQAVLLQGCQDQWLETVTAFRLVLPEQAACAAELLHKGLSQATIPRSAAQTPCTPPADPAHEVAP